MYKKIFKAIKSYNNIVIARHIGIDPDAMASQVALRDSIKLTFPEKKVYAVGSGSVRFNFMGRLDKLTSYDDDTLLIVLDTPDKKRVDIEEEIKYSYSIKIDHHPFIEKFCDIELIDSDKSSASEMVYNLIKETKLELNKEICEVLYAGIVADTNRFLFNNSKSATFLVVSNMLDDYNIDITKVYDGLYERPMAEVRMFGYMANNMKITENGVGFVKVTDDVLNKNKVDSATSGNLINEFNSIKELLVWITATEDVKNSVIRVSIRSKGPTINKVAERFGGGGHALASGVKLPSFLEVDDLIKELDEVCFKYIESDIESSDNDENN